MGPSSQDTPPKPTTTQLAAAAGLFYALMAGIGVWLIDFQGLDATRVIWGDGSQVVRDTLVGGGVGLAVVLIGFLFRDWGPLKRLGSELARELGPVGTWTIAVLALTSSVGEEILFRGAMQQGLGLIPTILIFGVLHGGFSKRLRLWAIFAMLAGAILGWLTLLTDNLLAPILCHLTINYFNLHLLVDEHRQPTEKQDGSPPE